jgi:hypothetical protein
MLYSQSFILRKYVGLVQEVSHYEKFHMHARPRSLMCHMDQGSIKLSAGPMRGRKSLITGVVPKGRITQPYFCIVIFTYVDITVFWVIRMHSKMLLFQILPC